MTLARHGLVRTHATQTHAAQSFKSRAKLAVANILLHSLLAVWTKETAAFNDWNRVASMWQGEYWSKTQSFRQGAALLLTACKVQD